MTIDETIAHYEKKAEECERDSHFDTDYVCYQMSEAERKELRECASEHRQLAEWLRELKQLRKMLTCDECVNNKESKENVPCSICRRNKNIRTKFRDYYEEVNADE